MCVCVCVCVCMREREREKERKRERERERKRERERERERERRCNLACCFDKAKLKITENYKRVLMKTFQEILYNLVNNSHLCFI